MSDLCIIAFDPGLGGAGAVLYPAQNAVLAFDMPVVAGDVDAASLAALLAKFKPDMAFVELVAARPGQGVSSMFKFGCGFGILRGVIAACGVPMTLVSPQKWKRSFGLDSDKEKSRAMALRLWPTRADLFGLKKHHGRAEAALLALYGSKIGGAS
jgi:crossover junction endodeoxyribonuclease RuvC